MNACIRGFLAMTATIGLIVASQAAIAEVTRTEAICQFVCNR